MKRGGPLARRTPLTRTAFKREPHQVPRTAKRRRQPPQDVKDAVWKRSGGMCEAKVDKGCRKFAGHMHHRRMRSQGGPDTVENLLHVCSWCHTRIHHMGAEAYERGWLLRAGSRPSGGSP